MNDETLEKKTFGELQGYAQKIRQDAKAIRKRWVGQAPSSSRKAEFQNAIANFEVVIAAFEERLEVAEKGSLGERDLCTEIGDCYGALGGTYRDWEEFTQAAKAYGKGRVYEKRVEDLGGQPNSYCLVQQLVNLILADPKGFSEHTLIDNVDVRNELRAARDTLNGQMRVARRGDPWAQADLALICQLLDDDAVVQWDELDDLEPKHFVYDAAGSVVRFVHEKLSPYLKDTENEFWHEVEERLS